MDDKKFLVASIEKADDGAFTAIVSTAGEDRHGEIIEQGGWDLKAYKTNPVILWGHDHSEPAIGKATRVWVDKTAAKPMLKIKATISEATTRAREIKQLMLEGIIKTFSVGFRPLEMEGNTYLKQELLEVSAVNVPANADAQMLAYKSLKKAGFEEKDIKDLGINTQVIDKLINMEKAIGDLQSAMKDQTSSQPPDEVLKKRQALARTITKASDIILGGDKHKEQIYQKRLVKVIKRASEILTTSQREQING